MNRRSLLAALIMASLIPAGGALAAPAPGSTQGVDTPSALALPLVDVAMLDDPHPLAAGADASLAFAQPPPEGTVYESVRYRESRYRESRYRPRRRRYEPPPAERAYRRSSDGFSQLHAGFLDPEGDERGPGFLLGFRGGIAADPHVAFGGMIDWRHKAEKQSELVSETEGPGGEPIEVRREFSRSSSDLVPVMGFLQFSAGSVPFSPYFGAAAGYEVLWLRAEDFTTGLEFDGTYGGFGWQVWGGAAFPLGGSARLVGELFLNQAEVARDVEDTTTGETFRETIDLDGAGMRFGLAWGF